MFSHCLYFFHQQNPIFRVLFSIYTLITVSVFTRLQSLFIATLFAVCKSERGTLEEKSFQTLLTYESLLGDMEFVTVKIKKPFRRLCAGKTADCVQEKQHIR